MSGVQGNGQRGSGCSSGCHGNGHSGTGGAPPPPAREPHRGQGRIQPGAARAAAAFRSTWQGKLRLLGAGSGTKHAAQGCAVQPGPSGLALDGHRRCASCCRSACNSGGCGTSARRDARAGSCWVGRKPHRPFLPCSRGHPLQLRGRKGHLGLRRGRRWWKVSAWASPTSAGAAASPRATLSSQRGQRGVWGAVVDRPCHGVQQRPGRRTTLAGPRDVAPGGSEHGSRGGAGGSCSCSAHCATQRLAI